MVYFARVKCMKNLSQTGKIKQEKGSKVSSIKYLNPQTLACHFFTWKFC